MSYRVTRVIRADFNNLWRDGEHDGVIIGARTNPDLSIGERVIVYDSGGSGSVDATVERITDDRVFLYCEWTAA